MADSDLWALLAPGPSASHEIAESLNGMRVGAVGNAFELAPWADFIAASDRDWWEKHAQAKELPGEKYAMFNCGPGITRARVAGIPRTCNSGVLALEVAKNMGATKIFLFGFDMHGSHFFGPYVNGLKNTDPGRRKIHLAEYRAWARSNADIDVINCTPGSAIDCFPFGDIDALSNPSRLVG